MKAATSSRSPISRRFSPPESTCSRSSTAFSILSKIEAGKMALSRESFDVREMIDELLDTVGPLVRKNNNTLTVRCGDDVGTMSSDLMKTRQILLNLLSNAGKFTRDGAVTLEVHAARRRRAGLHRVHGHRYRASA